MIQLILLKVALDIRNTTSTDVFHMTGFNVHLFLIDMKCIITLDLVYRRNYMFI